MSARDSYEIAMQADLLISVGRPEGAIELLGAGLAADPQNPYLLGSMGVAQLSIGNHELAREYLTSTLAIAPDDSLMMSNLALATVKKDLWETRSLAIAAIGLAPNDPMSHKVLALISNRLKAFPAE